MLNEKCSYMAAKYVCANCKFGIKRFEFVNNFDLFKYAKLRNCIYVSILLCMYVYENILIFAYIS